LFSKDIFRGFLYADIVKNILSEKDATDIFKGLGHKSISKLLEKESKFPNDEDFYLSKNGDCEKNELLKGYFLKDYTAHIENPEYSLFPFEKRLAAREIAKLVNKGMKVILTTNCDTIIKEFNALVLLGENFKNKEKIAKKLGYSNIHYLKKSQISIYEIQDGELKSCEYKEYAFYVKCMDDVIDDMNRVFNTLSFELEKNKT